MNELQRLLCSQQWLFFLKWMAPIVFVSLVTRFSGTKVDVTKFSQILLICSEAINIVFYFFLKTSQLFSNTSPIRQTALTRSKPWRHNWRETVPSSYFSQCVQADKRIANAALVKQEQAAGSTKCDWDGPHRALRWIGTNSLPENTHHDYFHVFLFKIPIQFQISAKAALVGSLHSPANRNTSKNLLASPRLYVWTHPTPSTNTNSRLSVNNNGCLIQSRLFCGSVWKKILHSCRVTVQTGDRHL